MLQHAGEHGIGEQPNILGKHAEDESVDEMRDGLRVVSACAKPLRETGELLGGFFREHLAGLAGLEPLRIAEDPFEALPVTGFMQIIKRQLIGFLDRVGPVRMNTKPVHVADDEQRRIFQGHGILLQLNVGGPQVLMLALIFPAEMATFPDIRPAVATGQFGCATLKAIPFTIGISLRGRWLVQQPAQVNEMLLGR
jgi:hypothetical protein